MTAGVVNAMSSDRQTLGADPRQRPRPRRPGCSATSDRSARSRPAPDHGDRSVGVRAGEHPRQLPGGSRRYQRERVIVVAAEVGCVGLGLYRAGVGAGPCRLSVSPGSGFGDVGEQPVPVCAASPSECSQWSRPACRNPHRVPTPTPPASAASSRRRCRSWPSTRGRRRGHPIRAGRLLAGPHGAPYSLQFRKPAYTVSTRQELAERLG